MRRSATNQDHFRQQLIDQFIEMLIASHAVTTQPLVDVFRAVPRHLFIDQYYRFGGKKPRLIRIDPQRPTDAQLKTIYSDQSLGTHHNRGLGTSSTSQPTLVARMLANLQIEPGMKILEIGAGTGWNAALMGHLVGPTGHVYSVDIQADLVQRARGHLRRLGCQNVTVIHADGGKGYQRHAPYDRIITTVACPDIFPCWMTQLRHGGILLITLQDIPGQYSCLLTRLRKQADHLRGEIIGLPYFMLLQGEYGTSPVSAKQMDKRLQDLKAGRKPRRKTMLWHCWARQGPWRTQDLFFFAYLEGLSIERIGRHYVMRYGEENGFCIPTKDQLEIYGSETCYRTLMEIIRKWLDFWAPRRDTYQMEVWPKEVRKRPPKRGWLVQREHSQVIFRSKKPGAS